MAVVALAAGDSGSPRLGECSAPFRGSSSSGVSINTLTESLPCCGCTPRRTRFHFHCWRLSRDPLHRSWYKLDLCRAPADTKDAQ
eukprot:4349159-Pyramimonas_sp.AAC.1